MTLKLVLIALGASFLLGCSTPSKITLIDGQEILTVDKPHYDKKSGFYEFKQYGGQRSQLNKEQIRSITEL